MQFCSAVAFLFICSLGLFFLLACIGKGKYYYKYTLLLYIEQKVVFLKILFVHLDGVAWVNSVPYLFIYIYIFIFIFILFFRFSFFR